MLAVTSAEVSVGLAIILQMFHHYKTLDVDELNKLKESK
jgi:NADH-quinone oxidoreductase subunit K